MEKKQMLVWLLPCNPKYEYLAFWWCDAVDAIANTSMSRYSYTFKAFDFHLFIFAIYMISPAYHCSVFPLLASIWSFQLFNLQLLWNTLHIFSFQLSFPNLRFLLLDHSYQIDSRSLKPWWGWWISFSCLFQSFLPYPSTAFPSSTSACISYHRRTVPNDFLWTVFLLCRGLVVVRGNGRRHQQGRFNVYVAW